MGIRQILNSVFPGKFPIFLLLGACYPRDMTLVVTHISALEIWRAASSLPAFPSACVWPLVSSRAVASAASVKPTAEEIAAFEGNHDGLSFPVHLSVVTVFDRYRNKRTSYHVSLHMAELPRGSFVRMEDGVFLGAPALVFVQLAERLSLARAIELGFELCGTYRLDSRQMCGFSPGAPLLSACALRRRVQSLKGVRGSEKALRALAYVRDNSASPMESRLAMLLCLPRRLGGYGLPQPQMNYRIDVGARSHKAASKDYYVCDLFWPDAKIAVEYDSDLFHTGSERIANDASRRNALLAQGVTVVTLTKRQVLNKQELDRAASLLAKALGKRQRAGRRDWTNQQLSLRAELLDFRAR